MMISDEAIKRLIIVYEWYVGPLTDKIAAEYKYLENDAMYECLRVDTTTSKAGEDNKKEIHKMVNELGLPAVEAVLAAGHGIKYDDMLSGRYCSEERISLMSSALKPFLGNGFVKKMFADISQIQFKAERAAASALLAEIEEGLRMKTIKMPAIKELEPKIMKLPYFNNSRRHYLGLDDLLGSLIRHPLLKLEFPAVEPLLDFKGRIAGESKRRVKALIFKSYETEYIDIVCFIHSGTSSRSGILKNRQNLFFLFDALKSTANIEVASMAVKQIRQIVGD